MAGFRKTLAHRLWQITRVGSPATSSSASRASSHLLNSGSRDEHGLLRRFLSSFVQKRPIFHPALPPDRHALPLGDRLLERICGLSPDRIRLDLLLPPSAPIPAAAEQEEEEEEEKRPPVARVDAARARLRATGKRCVSHAEFVRICCEASGGDRGMEVARSLDESGAVVVWGDVVFLRPEEVAKAIETVIAPSLARWSDAEREELREMEATKAEIDRSAVAHVRRELCCGLGLLAAQTAAFMRLTFWELSWDVMEPICFYITSIYFMAGYAFFLRTAREPSFEGFFATRFAARQKRLMKARNFDIHRFDELRRASPPPHRQLTPPSCNARAKTVS
ncbi:unnamed protein product [Musa acuminata subsp. malaccensis]|uniref:(wild Malaysian banana) hypothetical protein n=1 Tax=Musa acuminata subsp. malaccensis TaxID=214687 RepID=A0A804J7M0_MUSAM|nr:PREDICTED: calcium uniporter protein 3, mitochondrial-like [Musa acuminata subsp. malaccensis]CAG1839339.1 unnamed protein product [Musa acuminata subsp. malaccensis]